MKTKAKRLIILVKQYAEIKIVGQGNITIGFSELWEMKDVDVNWILEEGIDDNEFQQRLEHLKRYAYSQK